MFLSKLKLSFFSSMKNVIGKFLGFHLGSNLFWLMWTFLQSINMTYFSTFGCYLFLSLTFHNFHHRAFLQPWIILSKNLDFFVVIVNETDCVSFVYQTLLLYRNVIYFCMLILYAATLLNFLSNPSSFFVK